MDKLIEIKQLITQWWMNQRRSLGRNKNIFLKPNGSINTTQENRGWDVRKAKLNKTKTSAQLRKHQSSEEKSHRVIETRCQLNILHRHKAQNVQEFKIQRVMETNGQIKKWSRDLNREFSIEGIKKMAKKYLKRQLGKCKL